MCINLFLYESLLSEFTVRCFVSTKTKLNVLKLADIIVRFRSGNRRVLTMPQHLSSVVAAWTRLRQGLRNGTRAVIEVKRYKAHIIIL